MIKSKLVVRNITIFWYWMMVLFTIIIVLNDLGISGSSTGGKYGYFSDQDRIVDQEEIFSSNHDKVKNWRILFWGWTSLFIAAQYSFSIRLKVIDKSNGKEIW